VPSHGAATGRTASSPGLQTEDQAASDHEAADLATPAGPADIRLDCFRDVIQAAMGWEDYHMHVFSNGSVE